jgi:hypothetical protein
MRVRPRGRIVSSARTSSCPCGCMVAVARTRFVLPQVTSKRTLQCIQVTDAPAAIVRSSVRPSVRPFIRKRPRDNHGIEDSPFERNSVSLVCLTSAIYKYQTTHLRNQRFTILIQNSVRVRIQDEHRLTPNTYIRTWRTTTRATLRKKQ